MKRILYLFLLFLLAADLTGGSRLPAEKRKAAWAADSERAAAFSQINTKKETLPYREMKENVHEENDPEENAAKENAHKENSPEQNGPHENGGEEGQNPPAAHLHQWEEIWETVYHEAVCEWKDMGSYVEKEVEAAWDEPVYACRTVCNACGADITGEDVVAHSAACRSGYHDEYYAVDVIHHEPRYELRWEEDIRMVEVVPAYEEVIPAGYRCSLCGEVKRP